MSFNLKFAAFTSSRVKSWNIKSFKSLLPRVYIGARNSASEYFGNEVPLHVKLHVDFARVALFKICDLNLEFFHGPRK